VQIGDLRYTSNPIYYFGEAVQIFELKRNEGAPKGRQFTPQEKWYSKNRLFFTSTAAKRGNKPTKCVNFNMVAF